MKYDEDQVTTFADRLSKGDSPGQAAVQAGLTATHGLHLLNRIRKDLGKQAR